MADGSYDIDMWRRPLRPALLKGWRGYCPDCGGGALFGRYLKVRESCDVCGLDFSQHRADDAPSWLTMILVGHIIAPLMILSFEILTLPAWAHAVIWPVVGLTAAIVLLQRVKGGVIAFQWAHRMHGFDDGVPDPSLNRAPK